MCMRRVFPTYAKVLFFYAFYFTYYGGSDEKVVPLNFLQILCEHNQNFLKGPFESVKYPQ